MSPACQAITLTPYLKTPGLSLWDLSNVHLHSICLFGLAGKRRIVHEFNLQRFCFFLSFLYSQQTIKQERTHRPWPDSCLTRAGLWESSACKSSLLSDSSKKIFPQSNCLSQSSPTHWPALWKFCLQIMAIITAVCLPERILLSVI